MIFRLVLIMAQQHGYLHTLAFELANEEGQVHIRRAAGLAFKNALAARVSVRVSIELQADA